MKKIILLKKLLKIAKLLDAVKTIYQNEFYTDEPKIFSYTALPKNKNHFDNITTGVSFSKERALIKTLGESIERYILANWQGHLFWRSCRDLKEKAINPKEFVSFSHYRISPKFKLYKNENNKLKWIKGFLLTERKNIFVPAQLVFVPYRFDPKEPVIRFPITTGAACHDSLEKAILTGLLEVIERDAFMIFYLNELSPSIINLRKSQNKILTKIIDSIERYQLEFYVLDISTDVPVYSILAIIIDKTGMGPAISLGLRSDLNIHCAIVGAIEEAFHSRFWIKEIMIKEGEKLKNFKKEIQKKKYYISDLKERGILWSDLRMINKIKFLFNGRKVLLKNLPIKKTKNLNTLLKWFKKENMKVIYVDLTPSNLKNKKIYVVKVLVPEFQPLYLDERFPYWEGKRLKEIPQKLRFIPCKNINKFPHPFL